MSPSTTPQRKPDDWLWPEFDPDCCVTDEDGVLGEVSSADRWTRSQAITRYAREIGERRSEIRCRVAWIRPRTRQDEWDDQGADAAAWAWCDEHDLKWSNGAWRDSEGVPFVCPVQAVPPADWNAGDPYAVWTYAKKGEPEEVGYYVVTPHEVDAYSESYPVARFDFERVQDWIEEAH